MRVIQASLKQQTVKVTCGGQTIVPKATFGSVSSYVTIPPGTWTMAAIGCGDTATQRFTLPAGTVHTLVVLDGANGLEMISLEDAAGSGKPPAGWCHDRIRRYRGAWAGLTAAVGGAHRSRGPARPDRWPEATP